MFWIWFQICLWTFWFGKDQVSKADFLSDFHLFSEDERQYRVGTTWDSFWGDLSLSLNTVANTIIIWFSMICPIVYFFCKTALHCSVSVGRFLFWNLCSVSVLSWFTYFTERVYYTANRKRPSAVFKRGFAKSFMWFSSQFGFLKED